MPARHLALFLHILGALVLFGALAVEGTALARMRGATRPDAVRERATDVGRLRHAYPIAWLLLLFPGVFLTVTVWDWQGWIAVSLVATTAIAAAGAVLTGPRVAAVAAAGEAATVAARDPVLLLSYRVRLAVALAVVYLMTVKPWLSGALWTLASFVVLGALSVVWTQRRGLDGPAPS